MEDGLNGAIGQLAQEVVELEPVKGPELVPILHLNMVVEIALDPALRSRDASTSDLAVSIYLQS